MAKSIPAPVERRPAEPKRIYTLWEAAPDSKFLTYRRTYIDRTAATNAALTEAEKYSTKVAEFAHYEGPDGAKLATWFWLSMRNMTLPQVPGVIYTIVVREELVAHAEDDEANTPATPTEPKQ